MIESLSKYLDLPKGFVGRTLYGQKRNSYYERLQIPKKNGDVRVLHAVKGRLKTLQQNTYEKLSSTYKPSSFAKGFVKKSSIISHAKIHRNKKLIISFDIQDFFPSITWARVYGMFKAQPFNFPEQWAVYFAQICCLDDNGPIAQGAVTSPYVSNMLCRKLDSRLSKLARKERLDYSRYADDLTFSTNKFVNIENIKKWVEGIVNDESFELNHSKTRVLKKHQRQAVTGIIVNEGLNVNRKYIKNIRAVIHNCMKDGVIKHILKPNQYKDSRNSCPPMFEGENKEIISYKFGQLGIKKAKHIFYKSLEGRIQYVGQVAKANKKLNPMHYKTRHDIYTDLWERYNFLLEKEGEDSSIRYRANIELNRAKNDTLISKTDDMNKDQLEKFVQKRSLEDPRFFSRSFEINDINKFRKQVVELLENPLVNDKMVISLLSLLRDSQNNVLGKIVHLDDINVKKFMKSYDTYKVKQRREIPNGIRNIYDRLYNVVREEIRKVDTKIFSTKKFKSLFKHIDEFKRQTRFGANPNDSTLFDDRIMKISNEMASDFLKRYKKKVEIDLSGLNAKSFYTDVVSTLLAVKIILKSMYHHTPSSSNSKIIISSSYKEDDVIIKITSNKVKEISGNPDNRKLIAHGKIRHAIHFLNGLCDYSIIGKYDDLGWMEKNMMSGEKAKQSSNQSGFTHILRFKSCM